MPSGSNRGIARVMAWGYAGSMKKLELDHPVPMTEVEDAATLAAIDEAAAQLDAGQGIPLEELRKEISEWCSK